MRKVVVLFGLFFVLLSMPCLGRYYDPTIGRWLIPDPLAGKHPNLSPYVYSFNNPLKYIDPDGRDAIPVVFKDYLINYQGRKIPYLGHAGILLIDNKTGYTRYYEYGRYDQAEMGIVNNYGVPNVVMDNDTGLPTEESLRKVLWKIANKSGQGGMITAAYIHDDNFKAMMDYAESVRQQNKNPNRKSYSIWANSCNHFMKSVLNAGGVNTPSMFDPRPNSYIEELRDLYPNLEYSISNSGVTFTVENHDQALDIANRYHTAGYKVMIDGVEYNP